MVQHFKIIFFLFFCISISFCSCGEEELKLTRAHRKIVDSLVLKKRSAIRAELDSLCDLRFATEIDLKTDSIVKERVAEIKRKINSNAK